MTLTKPTVVNTERYTLIIKYDETCKDGAVKLVGFNDHTFTVNEFEHFINICIHMQHSGRNWVTILKLNPEQEKPTLTEPQKERTTR